MSRAESLRRLAHSCPPFRFPLACIVPDSRFVCPSHITCVAHGSPEQLRQLAEKLASPASLEDVVTHGLPSRLVALVSSLRQAQSVARLRPRSLARSLAQGCSWSSSWVRFCFANAGLSGLSVISCPAAPPDRSVFTHRLLWLPGFRCGGHVLIRLPDELTLHPESKNLG